MTRKIKFFKGYSWFKLNNFGLTPCMALKFYTGVAKGLKLKVRKFWGASSYVCRTYMGKTGRGPFWSPILNRVNAQESWCTKKIQITMSFDFQGQRNLWKRTLTLWKRTLSLWKRTLTFLVLWNCKKCLLGNVELTVRKCQVKWRSCICTCIN